MTVEGPNWQSTRFSTGSSRYWHGIMGLSGSMAPDFNANHGTTPKVESITCVITSGGRVPVWETPSDNLSLHVFLLLKEAVHPPRRW